MNILRRVGKRIANRELLPWRWTHLGGFTNTMLKVPVRRQLLKNHVFRKIAKQPEAITIVIGVRDRVDYKLANTLCSIRCQDCHQHSIKIMVVDYDNSQRLSNEISRICKRYSAVHLRVDNHPKWNKPHCYNIGIKLANTKYLMSCDADIIFAPTYLRTAMTFLRKEPLTVVYSQMLDLPESTVSQVQRWELDPRTEVLDDWRAISTPRSTGTCNEGINISYTYYYHLLHGYDEYYTEWGTEDSDLQKRFQLMGLCIKSIKDYTYYLHQWHPKYASLDTGKVGVAHLKNQAYFNRMNSIVRNKDGWGELGDNLAITEWSGS